jgi:hypothetical protein
MNGNHSHLQDLREDIRDWAEAIFGDSPIVALLTTDIIEFVVSSTRRNFGEEGVRKITEVRE